MSYERKCLCCLRQRERRHFFMVEVGGSMQLSLVCTDCVTGETPKTLLAGDGLWRVPVDAGQLRASL